MECLRRKQDLDIGSTSSFGSGVERRVDDDGIMVNVFMQIPSNHSSSTSQMMNQFRLLHHKTVIELMIISPPPAACSFTRAKRKNYAEER